MHGVYIHIPFCKTKCLYCDFYSIGTADCLDPAVREKFIRALKNEIDGNRNYIGAGPVGTIYIGGGTPSLLSPDGIQEIIDAVKNSWDCSGLKEITLEANPDDLSEGYLKGLVATDVSRLSIGVQSFSDRNLRFMNRRHNAQQSVRAVGNAQEAGFGNITIDLIYGVPGMGDEEWGWELERAVSLGVQHISAYHLTVEENTPLGGMLRRGEFFPVEEEASETQYRILREVLEAAGFEHYEISNFAREGFQAVHNSSYWDGGHYLGLGPSAHSYNGAARRKCGYSLTEYLESEGKGIGYEMEILTEQDKYNEYVMTSLRKTKGLNYEELSGNFGEPYCNIFKTSAGVLVERGLLSYENGYYRIPAGRFMLADNIISGLFVLE